MLAGANYFSFNLQQIGGPVIEDIKLVASKLKIMPAKYEEVVLPDVNHVDETLFFTSGYWNDKQTSITPGTNAFSKTFAASNVLSKESNRVKNKTEIVVEKDIKLELFLLIMITKEII